MFWIRADGEQHCGECWQLANRKPYNNAMERGAPRHTWSNDYFFPPRLARCSCANVGIYLCAWMRLRFYFSFRNFDAIPSTTATVLLLLLHYYYYYYYNHYYYHYYYYYYSLCYCSIASTVRKTSTLRMPCPVRHDKIK